MNDAIYDIECYSNFFSVVIYSPNSDKYFTYEVSERKNDIGRLANTINIMAGKKMRMVGFNNMEYDYPVLHAVLSYHKTRPSATWEKVCTIAKVKTNAIIDGDFRNRFDHVIWENNQIVEQVDLFKIHHFDNVSKSTSLKVLQFNMRSESIEEIPFDPRKPVDPKDFDKLLEYNKHDVQETYRFYLETVKAIEFREQLSKIHTKNFVNFNDTKIGKTIFQIELEEQLGKSICYSFDHEGKRQPRQTFRSKIALADVIFWYVIFKDKGLNLVHKWIQEQVLSGQTKDVFTGIDIDDLGELVHHCNKKAVKGKIKNLNCVVDGFKFVFGTGGLHGCVDPCTVESDAERVIVDLDVTSYYPSLAIENTVFPQHLGKEFCNIYAKLKKERMRHAKGSPQNAALKLALNGVYGDSNNVYSPFYDPQYTMAITINGQLLLCMLAEWLMEIDGLEMIQANTDGVTVRIDRKKTHLLEAVCKKWEAWTSLELESATYKRMFIRDVNNYIAEYDNGKLKRKGAYEYEIEWHKNFSCLIVQKAAEAFLINGTDIETFIRNHEDSYDFYLRAKVPRSSRLVIRYIFNDDVKQQYPLQNITRYYVSTTGGSLIKIMPPLPKKPDKWREFAVTKDRLVTVHDVIAPLENIDFDYYIKETEKLVKPLLKKLK